MQSFGVYKPYAAGASRLPGGQKSVRAPDGLDGLLVRPLPVQQGGIHVKHPLVWGGRLLRVIQASAAIQVTTVNLHGVHSSVGVWAGTGGLYVKER